MAERLLLAGAGNAEKGINAINPRFQAEALRRIRGRDTGVLDNSFYTATSAKGVARTANSNFMWKLSASNVSDIAVGRGMATAYGYDLQSEQTVHLVGTAATTGTKYIFVYLEWDLHNPDEAYGSINLHDNGSSSSWTPVSQDNLITNPTGIYQMPLYRLTVNTAGTVTAIASWASLGVTTIGYPLRSEYANRAEEADHADDATTATTATNYNTSSGTIKTKIEGIETRLDALGFKTGAITATSDNTGAIVIVPSDSIIRQLGKIVYGKLAVTVGSGYIGTKTKSVIGTFSSVSNIATEKAVVKFSLKTENSIDEDTEVSSITIALKDRNILLTTTRGENTHFTGSLVFSFVVDLYTNDVITSDAGKYPLY